MANCIVANCSNTQKEGLVKFTSLPKNEELRKIWINFSQKPNVGRRARMCLQHFEVSELVNNGKSKSRLVKKMLFLL